MNSNQLSSSIAFALSGAKGGDKPRKAVESPDSLQSIAHARIVDFVSEGEIEGFAHGDAGMLQDIYYNETPIENADGSKNFKNFQIESRKGTQDQTYIPGFPAVENEIALGVELQYGSPWVRSFTNQALSAVRIRLNVMALSKTDQENGDIKGHKVEYAIDVATDGGAYTEVLKTAFTGKSSGPYERSHRIELPTSTVSGWNLRVRRLTPQAASAYIADTTNVVSCTEIIDGKFRYPMSALVAHQIDASQFPQIPTRAFHLKGRKIKVPSNYNPVTRAYTGVWNGTFITAYSNNPAWVFYDLATHPRYGLGHLVSELVVDQWSLYAIGQYCDEIVPDNFGGSEPRMTCNAYLQRSGDAYKVLQDLASVFRGICYWAAGSIVPVSDRPTDPVFTYTNSNVVNGAFRYEGSSRRARHTAVIVGYNDMSDFGRQKFDYYDNPEGIARYGYQLTEIVAFGCTSRGQAQRMAKWLLLSEMLLTNSCSWSVGIEGTHALPGQIVRIADKYRAGRRMGGRIAAATANTITVDTLPTPVPGAGDLLITTNPQGLAQTSIILSVNAGTKVITATANFPGLPAAQSVWAIETNELKTQLFRVLAVTQNEDKTYGLFGMQHNPDLFDAVDLGEPISVPPTSVIAGPSQARPASVTVTAVERAGDVIAMPLLTAKWPAAVGATRYKIQWQKDNGEWSPDQDVNGLTADLQTPFPGVYRAKVSAINAIGVMSAPRYSAEYTLADQTMRPGFVAALEADISQALLDAENAQATADGSVVSFWQISPPTIGSGAGEAKVGDIWFDTNDGNRIWRVVGGVWVDAQDDQLAQALASASTAQATADGKVQTFFQSSAPTATAVGDLWFDTDDKKLYRWSGSAWSQNIADITLDQLAGTGVNQMWDEYARFPASPLPTVTTSGGSAAPVWDASHAVGTGGSLKATTQGTSTSEGFYLGSSSLDYNLPIVPGKYIVSGFVRSNVAGHAVRLGLRRNSDAAFGSGPSDKVIVNANTWERISFSFDWSADTSTACVPFLYINRSGVAGRIVQFDGLMMEAMVGTQTAPSAWTPGMSGRMSINAIAAASAAQDTADGKIETYFQTTMPVGSTLGDLWFDTDDGNKVWRHNGTTFVEIQDDAIAQAIANAAGAQATADGRVTTFYTSSAPTANANGDLWYDTVLKDLKRWNGSSWVKIGDITADKTSGRGSNLMWDEFSRFNNAGTFPTWTGSNKSGTLTNTFDATKGVSVNSEGSLKAVVNDPAGSATSSWFYFSDTSTDYNVPLVGGKKYLFSAFIATNLAAGIQVRFAVKKDDDGLAVLNLTSNVAVSGGSVFQRVSGVIDLSSYSATMAVTPLIYLNRQGSTTAYTVWLDRAMIEELVGNDTTPSNYAQGPSGRLTERAIANAAVAQATADGKIDSFYQNAMPGSASEGDLWFDTDDGNKIYTRRSGVWVATPDSQIAVAISNAAGAQATADGKITTFYQTTTPTAIAVGDLWYNKQTMTLSRWSGSVWTNNGNSDPVGGSGENLLPNSTLQQNTAGAVNNAIAAVNDPVGDGWYAKNVFATRADTDVRWLSVGQIRCRIFGTVAIASGGTVNPTAATLRKVPVDAGRTYRFSFTTTGNVLNGTIPGGLTVKARLTVRWYDNAGAQINYLEACSRDRTSGSATGTLVAPSNAVSAEVGAEGLIVNGTGASWTHDNTTCLDARFSSISMVKVADLDSEIADGTDYGRPSMLDLFTSGGFKRIGLRIGTSGHRLGNQRNNVRSSTSAYGMARTATALTANSSGQVSVNAHTVRYGGYSVAYNAVSNAVTGLTVGTTYVIYCTDPDLSGGTKTYFATTSPEAAMNISDDIYVVGQITIPSSGSSSGGSGSTGSNPNDWCVDADMVLPDGRRAGDVRDGDLIECWNYDAQTPAIEYVTVESNTLVDDQPCHVIVTSSGAKVFASDSTPMTLRDGRTVRMPEMLGEDALVRNEHGELSWEEVVCCARATRRTVAKIKVHQKCYFAGLYAGSTIATHNPIYKP